MVEMDSVVSAAGAATKLLVLGLGRHQFLVPTSKPAALATQRGVYPRPFWLGAGLEPRKLANLRNGPGRRACTSEPSHCCVNPGSPPGKTSQLFF